MKKWICLFLLSSTLTSLAQSGYNYSFTDPCTLSLNKVFVPAGSGVVVNYFDNYNTFTPSDFSSGVFDTWIAQVSQQNSNSPCQSVTAVVTNNVSSAVVSNVVAVSSLAQSMASIGSSIGSSMSATAGGVSNVGTVSPDTPSGEVGTTQGGSESTSNSVSNSTDGGNSEGSSSSGGSSSSSSKKQAAAKTSSGSLIASGDIVVISSGDRQTSNQYKIVGSITHSNTRGTKIKGLLFNFTTGANSLNVTLYKSYINKTKTLNTIIANSIMMDFDLNVFNTTTGLQSYKINKNLTAMFGLNFTAGKMGERAFLNLSSVGGGHVSTKVTDRTSTSFLILAIYSPFTQFYEGKWFEPGLLLVPFSSWDFKITKTFKYNVSLTGVYEMNKSFLNYQLLTGGKISF